MITTFFSGMFGRNDFLGELVLPLAEHQLENSSEQWYSLQERVGGEPVAGVGAGAGAGVGAGVGVGAGAEVGGRDRSRDGHGHRDGEENLDVNLKTFQAQLLEEEDGK